MFYTVLLSILSYLMVAWKYLKLAGNIFRIIGSIVITVSRLPGDLVWHYLESLHEDGRQRVLKAMVYLLSGFISVAIIVFLFKWVFGY